MPNLVAQNLMEPLQIPILCLAKEWVAKEWVATVWVVLMAKEAQMVKEDLTGWEV